MLDPVTKPQEPNMPSPTLGSCIFDSYIYSSFPKMNDNKHIDHNLLVRLGFFCLMEISTSLPTEFSLLFLLTIIS